MQEYVAILEQHGLCTLIIVVLLSMAIPLLKQWLENPTVLTNRYFKQSQLTKHSFFSAMQYWRKIGIDGIAIQDPGKALLIKDVLHIQFRLFDIMMKEMVADKHIQLLSPHALKHRVITQVTDCMYTYEQEARQRGIPELLITKFAKWHNRSLLFLMDGIRHCTTNTYYKSNAERLNGVLGIFLVTFNATIIDAERTLNDINGDLKGMTYKGITIKT